MLGCEDGCPVGLLLGCDDGSPLGCPTSLGLKVMVHRAGTWPTSLSSSAHFAFRNSSDFCARDFTANVESCKSGCQFQQWSKEFDVVFGNLIEDAGTHKKAFQKVGRDFEQVQQAPDHSPTLLNTSRSKSGMWWATDVMRKQVAGLASVRNAGFLSVSESQVTATRFLGLHR